jgi:hypothetical protein
MVEMEIDQKENKRRIKFEMFKNGIVSYLVMSGCLVFGARGNI